MDDLEWWTCHFLKDGEIKTQDMAHKDGLVGIIQSGFDGWDHLGGLIAVEKCNIVTTFEPIIGVIRAERNKDD